MIGGWCGCLRQLCGSTAAGRGCGFVWQWRKIPSCSVFLRVRLIRTSSFLSFFLILLEIGLAALFFSVAVIRVFPTHPLHAPSLIDRRPRLRLGSPGCLLGGALGGLSVAAPGYQHPTYISIGRSNTRRLRAIH